MFHLSQLFWRKVQAFGFVEQYKTIYNFRFNLKLILALAFAPEKNIVLLSDLLYNYFERENVDKNIFIMFNWFKEHFVGTLNFTNHHPKFWSVYERMLVGICRTTNSIEGYNRHLNNICNLNNPTVISLGLELVKEHDLNNKKLNDSFYDYWTKNKNDVLKCNELYNIIVNFEGYYDVEFLKAIVRNFNFPLIK